MTPKPAYHQLKALIKGKWWTRTEATVAPGGKTHFRVAVAEQLEWVLAVDFTISLWVKFDSLNPS